jgi:hypothetical protein
LKAQPAGKERQISRARMGVVFRAGRLHVRARVMDVVYLVGAVLLWFVLIKWVLPRFGVAT